MDVTTDEPMSGVDAMEALKSAGVLDDVLAKIDAGQLQLTGEGGFLPEMVKAVLERGLAAELSDHLGYEKGDPVGRQLPNARNGFTPRPCPVRSVTSGWRSRAIATELHSDAGPQGFAAPGRAR